MAFLNDLLPVNKKPRKWVAIGVSALLACLLTLWGIYVVREYGYALFVLTPFLVGVVSAVIEGYKREVGRRELIGTGFWAIGLCLVVLIAFSIEGFICVIMATPIIALLSWVGSIVGHVMIRRTQRNITLLILLLICSVPSLSFIEKNYPPPLTTITSRIEIKASPETVWKNMVAFPQLPEPTELIFKMGIAYPVDVTIEGKGVGAVRRCNFSTGSFVEPVTVWDEPRLLRFNVTEQPVPMKELSFWDVDAPHLHNYFVSKQGQFRLTPLPNGNTLLEGTSWYCHNIRPAFYWRLWSTYIIHKIHLRVFEHIKEESEK